MEKWTKIIELNTSEYFNNMMADDVIHGLLSNGYELTLTPCKYNNNRYSVMVEIGEIDESFYPKPAGGADNEIVA